MDFPSARALFPGTSSFIYLDVAARSLLSTSSEAAIHEQVHSRIYLGGDKPAMFRTVERVRSKLAKLINAEESEIALTKSVADGINMIAAAMPWSERDNVVVSDLEHPSNLYPWVHAGRTKGIKLKIVPSVNGHCDADGILAAIDQDTKVVALSTVTMAPGGAVDLAKIGAVCQKRDIFFLVDAAQSIGIMHTDVASLGVDALSASTQKGLGALYGLGFLYCKRSRAEKLTPAYLGRFSVDLGKEHEASFRADSYSLMPAAQRFEVGNHNYMGAIAVEPALDIILALGTEKIERHCCELAKRLSEGFKKLGLPVALSGAPTSARSHMVCVGEFDPTLYDQPKDRKIEELGKFLEGQSVIFSIRKGMLRFSIHLYNNREDIDGVLALATKRVRAITDAHTEEQVRVARV